MRPFPATAERLKTDKYSEEISKILVAEVTNIIFLIREVAEFIEGNKGGVTFNIKNSLAGTMILDVVKIKLLPDKCSVAVMFKNWHFENSGIIKRE